MNTTLQFIITLLLSGVIAALVSAVMQKRNEKESRLFNAKLEAYKEFAAHLESKFVSLTKEGKSLNITTLAEVSAKCLLISSPIVNKELKAFLVYVSEVYKRCCAPDYDKNKESEMFDKLWSDADKIEDLMRQDLGFK
ncbi:MAG: hypothetical protein AAB377_02630 [Patescibacteria group bacterium]